MRRQRRQRRQRQRRVDSRDRASLLHLHVTKSIKIFSLGIVFVAPSAQQIMSSIQPLPGLRCTSVLLKTLSRLQPFLRNKQQRLLTDFLTGHLWITCSKMSCVTRFARLHVIWGAAEPETHLDYQTFALACSPVRPFVRSFVHSSEIRRWSSGPYCFSRAQNVSTHASN